MDTVETLMQQGVKEKVFPGAVLLVSQQDKVVFHRAYGVTNLADRREMTKDTLFDLASLTKPLATTLAVMLLVKQNRLDLLQNLASLLPEFEPTGKRDITVEQLLAHNSGLPDYQPYYLALAQVPPEKRNAHLQELLIKEPLINPIGEKTVYSDIGYMILNWIIEKLTTTTLDRFVAEEVYRPLGIRHLFFPKIEPNSVTGLFAATEDCPWRKRMLKGVVHDENVYVMGGVGGHSGLFGTAEEVDRLMRKLLQIYTGKQTGAIFEPELVRRFFQRPAGSDRTPGFDTPARQGSSSGKYFSRQTIGHLGFTGTSFWTDLDRGLNVVLLTNRVHPSRENSAIKDFRPRIHNAIFESGMVKDER